jgi:Acyl-CoA carboxylase epsilon subunit
VNGADAVSPVITITKGRATPAELAAVLAVLAARRAYVAEPAPPPAITPLWAERSRAWFTLPRPGPRSWRASALPR